MSSQTNLIDDRLGLAHDLKAVFYKSLVKTGLYRTRKQPDLEKCADFDEYVNCEYCSKNENRELFQATDGARIVECSNCGLWFTNPRIQEDKWLEWLKSPSTERSRILTENRLKYGVALPCNKKIALSGWFRRKKKKYEKILHLLEENSQIPLKRLHDVGCGVGFFLLVARERGMTVSGNDLNRYAVKQMTERFNLTVYDELLSNIELPPASVDAIVMDAFIEHSYHPLQDLQAACTLLRKGGLIYVSTFHTDSAAYRKLGPNWNMFTWNHTYHFSSRTLSRMIEKAGFRIVRNNMKFNLPVSWILAKK